MNAKLIFKTVFLVLTLLLLVLMGLNNKSKVSFALPPLIPKAITQPAAIMYFAFFAVGLVSGVVISTGGGKKGSAPAAKTNKGDK